MDPFTAKLLERTKARRENLQKKMADASSRQMAKRPREPLMDSNGLLTEPVIDKAPQMTAKPSPSKRKCSGENIQPTSGEENLEPAAVQSHTPSLPDPPTVQVENSPLKKSVQPQPKTMAASPAPPPVDNIDMRMNRSAEVHQKTTEVPMEDSAPPVRGMKSRLQRLAEQRKGWDGTEDAEEDTDYPPLSLMKRPAEIPLASPATVAPAGRKGRLANLAATIGSWEDDLSHANIPKENPKEKSATSSIHTRNVGPRCEPQGHPASGYKSANKVQDSPMKAKRVFPSTSNQTQSTTSGSSLAPLPSPQKPMNPRAACPSVAPITEVHASVRSPAHKTNAVSPKVQINSSKTSKPEISKGMQESASGTPGVKSFVERFGECYQERVKQTPSATGTNLTKSSASTPSATPNSKLVQSRFNAFQGTPTSTADLTQQQKLQRESELAQIRNRFQKANNQNKWVEKDEKDRPNQVKDNKEHVTPLLPESNAVPSGPKDDSRAPSNKETISQINKTKDDAQKPPLPKSSAPTEAVVEAEHKQKKEDQSDKVEEVVREIEMNVDQSINSAVINDIFSEALQQSDDDDDEEEPLNISSMSLLAPLAETVAAVVRSPEGRMMTSTPACSFMVRNNTPDYSMKETTSCLAEELLSNSSDSFDNVDDELPYSISSYRSIRLKEKGRPQVTQEKGEFSLRAEEIKSTSLLCIKQKIKILTNEMNLQQTIIHQASQALNCCTDEEHGKGSQVEAEAERVLLVATERGEALKKEIERLRMEGPSKPKKMIPVGENVSASMGSITLHELRLPLKADFVCSIAYRPEATKYSFFIMIRAGAENTVATPLASTHRGLSGDTLTFPTKFTISDISSDFAVNVEVYCLVQKREIYTDKKKKTNKSKAITPKRFLAITKSGQTPVVASPGGPNAVRTSNFALVGSHKITLSSIGISKFALEKVPFTCPLDGSYYLKMQCKVGSKIEERGFLTMFEDVSGFGAWHRRWCVLSGYCISYWTYPDDEKRKNPMGRINLANCTSRTVEPAKREFCARPHTFELITVRPKQEDDRETLVSQCENRMCVTKNWLSADTKDERNSWMKKLNQILVDLRMWQPDSCQQPL